MRQSPGIRVEYTCLILQETLASRAKLELYTHISLEPSIHSMRPHCSNVSTGMQFCTTLGSPLGSEKFSPRISLLYPASATSFTSLQLLIDRNYIPIPKRSHARTDNHRLSPQSYLIDAHDVLLVTTCQPVWRRDSLVRVGGGGGGDPLIVTRHGSLPLILESESVMEQL
jgi:hypothetical protein